jgi:hypothetical protein
VADVAAAVARLRDHGDALGFGMNGIGAATGLSHWEGLARTRVGDRRRLVVSRKGEGKAMVGVDLGSRDDDGRRWRSNRLSMATPIATTPPPATDVAAWELPEDEGFDHVGGLQALGRLLAVPLENATASRVVFFDVGSSGVPARLGQLDRPTIGAAGTATLAKLADGRTLLVVGRYNAQILDFYVSLDATGVPRFGSFATWDAADAGVLFDHYQNIDAIPQCDGALFLVATTRTDVGSHHIIDAWRLADGSDVAITKVSSRQVLCDTFCDFGGAAGAYVTPAGELYLYATEFQQTGPAGSVSFEEFRPTPPSTSCATADAAWVELFDTPGFIGQSLMLDWRDRANVDIGDYARAAAFDNRAASARWCLPSGMVHRLWTDAPCAGTSFDLTGVSEASTLPATIALQVSCSQWVGP